MSEKELIFSLDIGTRKVAGVILEKTAAGLNIIATQLMEHPDRAMIDGQVHKIEAVAQVVRKIKCELEKKIGVSLKSASVAAAGRALLTESAEKKIRFPYPTEVTRDDVRALELSAASAAQSLLQSKEKNYQLHCVGYSPVWYKLDNECLDDLVGHQAKEIMIKVIATFLPRQVVDSMLTVLRQAGLEAESLTLEPIAAIEATIPQDLRRMNLALVDIGAGTSDIALTREGSVFAYDMVTIAGDEVTEFLCDHYLLEFNEAERLKREINQSDSDSLHYQTILGQKQIIDRETLLTSLEPVVKKLAEAIADSIITLNESPPRAVILVGGGSATPLLGKKLATSLNIDEQRIGLRGPDTIEVIKNSSSSIQGIEWVTPIGIALTASKGHGLRFNKVIVNEQAVQLLVLNQGNTLFDALLAAGREVKYLHARPGQAITYTLAGKLMTLPGKTGQPAKLKVNGQEATLDTRIEQGAIIELKEAVPGADAILMPDTIVRPHGPFWCFVNDERIELDIKLYNEEQKVDMNESLPDRAKLEWKSSKSLIELVPELKNQYDKNQQFSFKINGKERKINENKLSIKLKDKTIEPSYYPKAGDHITWTGEYEKKMALHELVEALPQNKSIMVTVNGEPKTIDTGGSRILVNGHEVTINDNVSEKDEIQVETINGQVPILSHVLEGITPPPQAGPIKIRVNGQSAGFATPLEDGAKIEITFG